MKTIVIIGPTASGKTTLATRVALRTGGELISADSRQVYRGMNIGTGKDLDEYVVDGQKIPFHLIDIVDAGEKYNLYKYQNDFFAAWKDVVSRGRQPVVCGGSGLYVESVLKGYRMTEVPPNAELRERLYGKSLEELTEILSGYKSLHNTTDTDTVQRAVRAIEIEEYYKTHEMGADEYPDIEPVVIGVDIDRELRRAKITRRLDRRLKEGLVEEVRALLESGIASQDLIYYGLEYKYVTLHVLGQLSFDEMRDKLEIAIHQFAKRQMTWFRGMEKRGTRIHWIEGEKTVEEQVGEVLDLVKNEK